MAIIDGAVTGAVNGALIGLRVNGDFISCETSCSFNFDVDMMPASSVVSGRWAENIPGVRSWTMTVDMNLLLVSVGADIKTVLNAVLTGESVELEFRTRLGISPEVIISGMAYPRTGGITAPSRGKATANVEFVGNGSFNVSIEEFWLIINNMPIDNDYQTTVEMDWSDW